MTERVNAVLYARDMNRLLDFYCAVLNQRCVYRDAYHAVLRCGIFALDIHQLPAHALQANADAAEARKHAALKLSFPVDSIERARRVATEHGGELDAPPPRWVVEQQKICDGVDPEGNVFQLREDD
ncbi:MAG: VOC family protein [Pseudomonadota bacterium]|nr:VOC family protein [Pseudomonadota bacterium]